MALFRRGPNVKRLRRRGDIAKLAQVLTYTEEVVRRDGRRFDLGVKVRVSAVTALAELPDPEAVPTLAIALGDRDVRVRAETIRALRERGDAQAAEPLARCFLSSHDKLRGECGDALVDIATDDTAALFVALVLVSERDVGAGEEEVLARLIEAGHPHTRDQIVRTLIEALGSEDERPAEQAERLLRRMPDETSDALIDALHDRRARARAAALLGSGRDSRATPALINLLGSEDPAARAAAARALGEIRDVRAVEGLLRATADPNFEVRDAAGRALDRLGTVALVMGVTAMLRSLVAAGDADAGRVLPYGASPVRRSLARPIVRRLLPRSLARRLPA